MSADLHLGLWGRNRLRLVRQSEGTECGLAALAMIFEFHGLSVDLAALRRQFAPSLRGSGLGSLIAVADTLGFSSRAVKLPLENLRNLSLPAVLHWNMNHFVALERVKGDQALIHDPAGFTRWYSFDELSKHFTGVALELFPGEDFRKEVRRERLRLPQLWSRVTGLRRAILQTIVLSLIMQAFVVASPYYLQLAIDTALPAFDLDLLTVLALGFVLFTLVNTAASLLRSFVLLSAGTSVSYAVAVNIARRLFRLPIGWFEKRHVADILSRFQSVVPIQLALTQGAVAALLDGLLGLLLLAVMFLYSTTLAMLALLALALYALVRAISFALQRRAQENAIVGRAKEQSMLMENIRGIVTLRLFNRESARHALWQGRLVDALNADVHLARIAAWQQAASALILGLETVVSVWLSVRLVMAGGFSLGMLFAYMAYKTQFLTRAASLIDQAVSFRMLGLHLDRLSDIALNDEDPAFSQPPGARTTLEGRVELKNLRFRYAPADPLILDGASLLVEPGAHVAITGPSGGGKSTLVKVLVGLLQPEDGDILIDGQPLRTFGYKNFHDQIGAVLQEDCLFAGSLAHNIALFDDAEDMDRVVAAASAAAIHAEIVQMPMGYETMVGDLGSALSSGQKQRVLLARALYRKPRFLIVDEGTAHLDPTTESAVNRAVSGMGITRIVVAHRRETLAAADRVFLLAQGRLREVAHPDAAR